MAKQIMRIEAKTDYNRGITGTDYRPLQVRGHMAQGLWLDAFSNTLHILIAVSYLDQFLADYNAIDYQSHADKERNQTHGPKPSKNHCSVTRNVTVQDQPLHEYEQKRRECYTNARSDHTCFYFVEALNFRR
jgi:hypothetical protein